MPAQLWLRWCQFQSKKTFRLFRLSQSLLFLWGWGNYQDLDTLKLADWQDHGHCNLPAPLGLCAQWRLNLLFHYSSRGSVLLGNLPSFWYDSRNYFFGRKSTVNVMKDEIYNNKWGWEKEWTGRLEWMCTAKLYQHKVLLTASCCWPELLLGNLSVISECHLHLCFKSLKLMSTTFIYVCSELSKMIPVLLGWIFQRTLQTTGSPWLHGKRKWVLSVTSHLNGTEGICCGRCFYITHDTNIPGAVVHYYPVLSDSAKLLQAWLFAALATSSKLFSGPASRSFSFSVTNEYNTSV